MEASPSYLYGGKELANRIHQELGNRVFSIVLLRDPVVRFISSFKHAKYVLGLPSEMSLMEYIEQSHALINTQVEDNRISRGIREGFYIDYLPDWMDAFPGKFKLLFFENFIVEPKLQTTQIFNWLNLDEENIQIDTSIENKTRNFNSGGIHKISLWLNQNLHSFFQKFPRFKKELRKAYQKINGKETIEEDFEQERLRLTEIYNEKNLALKTFLLKAGYLESDLPKWLK